jgi:GxxExxY protein
MEEKARYQLSPNKAHLAQQIVDCAYQVHSTLGPGLLEHVYEICFCHELQKRGIAFRRQVPCSVVYDGIVFDEGFRIDVIVDERIICEIKAIEAIGPKDKAQLLTYLRLTEKRIGFVINFHADLLKNGIRRLVL